VDRGDRLVILLWTPAELPAPAADRPCAEADAGDLQAVRPSGLVRSCVFCMTPPSIPGRARSGLVSTLSQTETVPSVSISIGAGPAIPAAWAPRSRRWPPGCGGPGLSDTGDLTGRGSPYLRGAITGAGTFLGGVLHTLPFLIPAYRAALIVAFAVIAFELVTLAWIRWRFFDTDFLRSFVSIALGGAIIASVSVVLGAVS
jgi:hypothetical protein